VFFNRTNKLARQSTDRLVHIPIPRPGVHMAFISHFLACAEWQVTANSSLHFYTVLVHKVSNSC
jgi:hypothetical protein